ncbi:pectate lyase family protein [Proteiniphilum sp. UBA1028]|uniref:pectate lyase family protein n=1 Tax=Proteiniphilum sp. UBA1028 TaxID=1947251 RepID=UPI0025E117BB|nr:polysaccharide lyase [Proteiniphilum sp. UBA1028]
MKLFTRISLFLILSTFVPSFMLAQYPLIPVEDQEQGDAFMNEVKRRAEEAWAKALPIVEKEAREGRPYIPWAGTPKALPQASIPAFPGAEGGGMFTCGGRGGKVFVVTSLEDNGPGTFREACEAGGARIVVFNVSGIIRLKTPISIRAPYITIAGQTAPGDGVVIAGESVDIDTHDVIIRHMRFRRGEVNVLRRDDAVSGEAIGNIIIDHTSASWGLDESLSLYRNMWSPEPDRHPGRSPEKLPTVNITVQNSIIAETLDTYNHAFGSTFGGLNSTMARNLFANNVARNPSVGMWGDFSFVNNVIFNWWNRTMDGGDYRSMWNIINNYYKPGPITPEESPIRYRIAKPEKGSIDSTIFGRIYANGNRIHDNKEVSDDNWAGGIQLGMPHEEAVKYFDQVRARTPFPMADVRIMPAPEAFEWVLDHAGATIPKRDEVDTRIVKQARTGVIEYQEGLDAKDSKYVKRRLPADSYKKGIITDISQVGGYPEYNGTPYTDSDSDGMPDWWEEKHGLNPNDPADANGDINGDGYTNIEKFINGINPETKVDWSNLQFNYDTLREKGYLHQQ